MARIRNIKPEVCTSRTVAGLSLPAQLLWERLWCFCDAEGRLDYHPAIVKGHVFPLVDSITQEDVAAMVQELAAAGLVLSYSTDGHEYIAVTNWHEHQRPRNESPSKLPPPPAPPPAVTHFVRTPCGQSADGVQQGVQQMSAGVIGNREEERDLPHPQPGTDRRSKAGLWKTKAGLWKTLLGEGEDDG